MDAFFRQVLFLFKIIHLDIHVKNMLKKFRIDRSVKHGRIEHGTVLQTELKIGIQHFLRPVQNVFKLGERGVAWRV